MEQFLGSVLAWFEIEEILVLIDELSVHCPIQELMITQHILEKGDVCLWKKKKKILPFSYSSEKKTNEGAHTRTADVLMVLHCTDKAFWYQVPKSIPLSKHSILLSITIKPVMWACARNWFKAHMVFTVTAQRNTSISWIIQCIRNHPQQWYMWSRTKQRHFKNHRAWLPMLGYVSRSRREDN